MKPVKVLGLGVLLALTAMAFAGTASVTAEPAVLCQVDNEEECEPVSHVHEATLPGAENRASLLTNIATIRCQVLFLGEVIEGGQLTVEGNFTYTECNLGCSITELGGSALKVLKTGHETATVTGGGEALVKCPLIGIHCVYSASGLTGSGKGPLLSTQENGEVLFKEQTLTKVSGSGCPSSAKLDITTTPSEAVYLSASKMVCIFVGAGKGFYLGASGTACTNSDFPNRTGSYELGSALTDDSNEMVCAWVGNALGLWLARRAWPNRDECKESDAPTRSGEWELGTTQ